MLLPLACLILLQNPIQSLPIPVLIPPNGYTIAGKLVFESNVPVSSMEVSLEVDDGGLVQRTMSGPNGEFRFDRLRYGRYFVVIEGGRFWNIRETVNVDQGTFDQVAVSIALKSRPGLTTSGGSDTISVDTLRRTPPPKEAQKEYEKAIEEQRKGQNKKAIEHLQKALRIAPDYYEANFQLGVEQHRAGKVDDAIRLLEKAVALHSSSIQARHALGKIYFEKQEFRKAADILADLTKLGVSDPEIYTLLGATFYKLNDFEKAEEHLRRAITLSPETTGSARLQLYNVYMKSNRLPQALEELETYLKQFPNAPDRAGFEQQAAKLKEILKK